MSRAEESVGSRSGASDPMTPGLALACAGPLGALLMIMAARLGPVATVIHVAPAARMIAAQVQKQPTTAAVVGTLSDPVPILGGQQIGRRANDRPKHPF